MIIFIDESGTFTEATHANAWNVVAAYVIPERSQTKVRHGLASLKSDCGFSLNQEIKLNDIPEEKYLAFLFFLSKLPGCLFATASDGGRNPVTAVITHRDTQANQIRENIPRMLFEEGKQTVENLASNLQSLSPQLYVQLQCQTRLIHDVINRGLLYFAQRDPQTLGRFKWRIDQKTSSKATFEQTFKLITPGILQSMTLRDPMPVLEDADYSYLRPYEYEEGKIPEYITARYGAHVRTGINVGRLFWDNLEFPDSRDEAGIQIADLLASGLRRCLRGGFSQNILAAALLGSLMLRNKRGVPAVQLLSLTDTIDISNDLVADYIRTMNRHSRNILK